MSWTTQFSSATVDPSSPRFLNVFSIPNINIVSNDIFALATVHPVPAFSVYFTCLHAPANQPPPTNHATPMIHWHICTVCATIGVGRGCAPHRAGLGGYSC